MNNAHTTRETADHAELKRLAEAAKALWLDEGWFDYRTLSLRFELDSEDAAFIAAANPATVLALLSEIAALRGDLTVSRDDLDQLQAHFRQRDREATQAERQRDEATAVLIDIRDVPYTEQEWPRSRALNFLANQGADQCRE